MSCKTVGPYEIRMMYRVQLNCILVYYLAVQVKPQTIGTNDKTLGRICGYQRGHAGSIAGFSVMLSKFHRHTLSNTAVCVR